MADDIDPAVGGIVGRDSHSQFGVDDGHAREHQGRKHRRLLMRFPVGIHPAGIGFGTGRGQSRDGHNRQGLLDRGRRSVTVGDKIPYRLGFDRRHGDGLGRIHRRSAAEADHEIAFIRPGQLAGLVDGRRPRIGLDGIAHDGFDAFPFEIIGDFIENTVGGRRSFAGDDQGPPAEASGFDTDLFEGSGPEDDLGRQIEREILHGSNSLIPVEKQSVMISTTRPKGNGFPGRSVIVIGTGRKWARR